MKLDIRGFVRSLKINAYGALREVMVKYVLSPLLKSIHCCECLPQWLDLFRDLLKAKQFLLIVLDDARYDVFENVHLRYLKGVLHKAVVPPPHTYGWLPRVFSLPEFNNVRIFYASIVIETHDIRIKDFVPRSRDIEVYAVKPKKLKYLKTVLPNEVNEVVRNIGLSGRDIVWYAQPHFPWICDIELSSLLMHEVLIHDFVPPDTVGNALKRHDIRRERILKAYYCNMEVALRGIKELLEYIHESRLRYNRIVITSDHGEMLGEYGLYLHQEYDLPQLTIVPWFEVEL